MKIVIIKKKVHKIGSDKVLFRKDFKEVKKLVLDYLIISLGCFLYAVSIVLFAEPNDLAPGGISGLCIVIKSLTGFPVGTASTLINLPLFVIAYKKSGISFFLKTLYATLFGNFLIDLTKFYISQAGLEYKGELFIASVLSGAMAGIGLGLIFMRGGTAGGVDIIASLVSDARPHISIGKVILFLDGIVILISAFVFKIENAFYACVCVYVMSKVVDGVMYGSNIGVGKVIFIISEKSQEISSRIITEFSRGVTELKSCGSYTRREGEVLLCAVRRYELYKIYSLVYSIDPQSFLIVTDTKEITGEGFKQFSDKKRK
ncbi:MAG: YitT family protein [Oscillospiraceae bacterium]|nr:YitT family protein [Oscillospiraceae bacterium]